MAKSIIFCLKCKLDRLIKIKNQDLQYLKFLPWLNFPLFYNNENSRNMVLQVQKSVFFYEISQIYPSKIQLTVFNVFIYITQTLIGPFSHREMEY